MQLRAAKDGWRITVELDDEDAALAWLAANPEWVRCEL